MMKKIVLTGIGLMLGLMIYSQPKMVLSTTEHDFGKFKEEAGAQTFDFLVTNNGDSPLVITQVTASCGCTTPGWTKEPIPAKGTGKVSAAYDPAGRPGVFNKTLAISSNSKPDPVVLVIKGEVIAKEKTVEDLYTFPVGTIRFESNHLAFTNIKKTEKRIRVMPIINTSAEPVKVEFENLPVHLIVKANPEVLKPGEKGIIEGTYDGTKNPNWGNVSDMVKVKLNGITQENVYLYVSANLGEDFSGLSKEELENAPVFKLASTSVDFGTMLQNTTKEVIFPFTNTGKRDLVINFVKSTCGCTAVQQGTPVVKPGESSSIKAVFSGGTYSGKQTKAIYVYTNDPKNSEVILMLTGEVTPQPSASAPVNK
jgi:hypothetical protein